MKNNLFIKVVATIFVLYTLLGFLLIPYIAKDQIIKNLDNILMYKSDLKSVWFNPYTFNLKLDDFSISNNSEKLIGFDEVEIDFSLLKSIHESHISFKALNIVKPYVNIVQNEKGEINLSSLLKPQENKVEEKPETQKSSIPSFKISKTKIVDGNFLFTQIFNSNKTTTNLNGFNYTFYDIGTYKNSLASHSLVTNINKETKLYVDGGFRLIPFKMYGKVKLENLKVKEYLGYSKDLLNFDINEPTLNLTFGYRVDTTNELKLNLDKLSLDLNDLKILRDEQELAGLNNFKITNLSLDLNKQKIEIEDITLNSLFANVALSKNQKSNLDNLINTNDRVKKEDKIEEVKDKKPWDITLNNFDLNNSNFSYDDLKNKIKIKASGIAVLLDNVLILDDNIKIKKSTLNTNKIKLNDELNKTDIEAKNININLHNLLKSTNQIKLSSIDMNNPIATIILEKKDIKKDVPKEEKKVTENKSSDNSSFALDIGPVNINNANLTFEDKNLAIPFKSNITKLNGNFSELNTKSSKPTKLKLEGKIDKYGYTRITGTVDEKNIKNLTNVDFIFKNIAMNSFTPYSNKFVGREVKDGKLNLNLHYNITKSNLDAQNNVLIQKIKLSKILENSEGPNLPLDLGIALLEDSDGMIDIDLPIKGNVDDPQFSVAPIIWKVFTNLIIKAVASPFSLLASILGIDEDSIKKVEFIYGESNLIDSEKEALDNIAKAFEKRPNLALKVEPMYDKIKDKVGLQTLKLENQLIKDMKKFNEGDKYLLALEARYPSSLSALRKEFMIEENGKKTFDKESYIAKIKSSLTPKIEVTTQELEELAKNRISSIKEYLLKEHAIGDKRLFINDKITVVDNKNAKYAEFALAIDIKKK